MKGRDPGRAGPRRGADPRRALGAAGERIAARHLEARGLEILDRNYHTRHGELDLVALDARSLVFCEVKTRVVRGAPGPFGPLSAIGPRKQRQVRAMAREWFCTAPSAALLCGRSPPETRFDAIGVTLDPAGRLLALEHLEAAF